MSSFVRVDSSTGAIVYQGRIDKAIASTLLIDVSVNPIPTDRTIRNEYKWDSATSAWVADTAQRTLVADKEALPQVNRGKLIDELTDLGTKITADTWTDVSGDLLKELHISLRNVVVVLLRQ